MRHKSVLIILFLVSCSPILQKAKVADGLNGGIITYYSFLPRIIEKGEYNYSIPTLTTAIAFEYGYPASTRRPGFSIILSTPVFMFKDSIEYQPLYLLNYASWGFKMQLPEQKNVDIATGIDLWGIYPEKIYIILSKDFRSYTPIIRLFGGYPDMLGSDFSIAFKYNRKINIYTGISLYGLYKEGSRFKSVFCINLGLTYNFFHIQRIRR